MPDFPFCQLTFISPFVKDIPEHDDGAIATAIIGLGHSLGNSLIAEGVETEAQRDFLTEHGCEACQGYLFSQPLDASALRRWMSAKDWEPLGWLG